MIELPLDPAAGWRMTGEGGFRAVDGVLESEGGSGLLWWPQQSFADFRLRVEWRVQARSDNSGVFLRLPPLDGEPQAAIRRAVAEAYEIQIDERGFDPQAGREGSPLHATGAVYRLARVERAASKPVGEWNLFAILARGPEIAVSLNGAPAVRYVDPGGRRREGFVGLQAHHAGSRVQFRALRVEPL